MEYTDALNLLAAIVKQARKDIVSHPFDVCKIPYSHAPKRCASEFLSALDMKIVHAPRRMSIEEMAFAVLEIIE